MWLDIKDYLGRSCSNSTTESKATTQQIEQTLETGSVQKKTTNEAKTKLEFKSKKKKKKKKKKYGKRMAYFANQWEKLVLMKDMFAF